MISRWAMYRIVAVCFLMRVLRFDRKIEGPIMELLIRSEAGQL